VRTLLLGVAYFVGVGRGAQRGGSLVAANLDDWIDEAIEVEFVTREEDPEPQKETDYTLEGADERGILLGYQDESDLSDYKIVFSPGPG
jgi:hypothetical protein